MHVAYIHQHFATRKSASGTRSYELSQCLIRAGHRVSMICGFSDATRDLATGAERVERSDVDGIDVHCITEDYSNSMGFYRRIQSFLNFAGTARKVVAGLDADIVYATSTPLTVGIPGVRGARKLKAPFVFEVRDLWPELPIAMGVVKNPLLIFAARRLERWIYRNARHIVALSPGMKDGIAATGYPADEITMIPNSCDLDLFAPSNEPLDDERFGPPADFRLVFCGAHGLANGLDAVLDAAAEIKRRGVRGLRFVFIGLGRERDRLMTRARDEGTDGLTTWIPFIPKTELARVLPRLDVGMMILKNVPQFYYGTSPNKFFDYIASGIPVLNNYPGWVADMIDENRCGVVVPPEDPKAFADAAIRLMEDRPGCRDMGARGRALAERDFDRIHLGARLVEVLERVCREFPRRRT